MPPFNRLKDATKQTFSVSKKGVAIKAAASPKKPKSPKRRPMDGMQRVDCPECHRQDTVLMGELSNKTDNDEHPVDDGPSHIGVCLSCHHWWPRPLSK